MTALSTLLAACFGPTRTTAPRRSVALNVESLEERQVLSGSPMMLPRAAAGAAIAAPERMQADESIASGWYVEVRRPGKRWNVRGPFETVEEALAVRIRLRRQKVQARSPMFVAPQEPAEVPVVVIPVPFEVDLRELKR